MATFSLPHDARKLSRLFTSDDDVVETTNFQLCADPNMSDATMATRSGFLLEIFSESRIADALKLDKANMHHNVGSQ